MKFPKIRTCFLLGFLCCVALFLAAAYFQFVLGFAPCPLCQLQRYALVMVAFFYLLAAIQNPGRKGIFIYSLLILLFSIIGALFAGRQVWLQQVLLTSGNAANCGVGFDYLVQTVPLLEAIKLTLMGTADCAEQGLLIFGLSMASWTLAFFILLSAWALIQMVRGLR